MKCSPRPTSPLLASIVRSSVLSVMVSTLVSTLFSITSAAEEPEGKDIRVGIIGLDTSHVVAFTKLLNGAGGSDRVSGARVVAGFPGGTADNPASASRVEEYTKELSEKWGVEIVPDIPTLLAKVDAVLLESVDGRPHLEQVRPVLAARKPVYIDKPLAGSFRDAREIVRLAKESGVPCFSASSLRFWPGVAKLRGNDGVGEILGCDAYSPCHLEEHHPDLYWYGVHGVEILFALMGPGCVEVSRTSTSDFDLVVGRWKDGRVGTYRGIRKGAAPYGASVFGTKGMRVSEPVSGDLYRPLVAEIVKFFRTGEAPVPLEETLEMFAFMSAADLSEERKGAPVRLEEILEVGAAPDDPRGRTVVLAAGEIEVKEFARFLGHFTGLPVISSGGEGFLQKRITIAAPVRDVDDELARKILGLGGVRARERTIDGRRVLILEDAESPEPPLEPEPRPIIVPGKPAGK